MVRPPSLLSKLGDRRQDELLRCLDRRRPREGLIQPGPEVPMGEELELEQATTPRSMRLRLLSGCGVGHPSIPTIAGGGSTSKSNLDKSGFFYRKPGRKEGAR